MSRDSLHPAYFEIRFRGDSLPSLWPEHFAIITAYATTGQKWSDDDNNRADRSLFEVIVGRGLWHVRLTGYSPHDGHAEPGWAVAISLDEARNLGRQFLQDAIFWVTGDELWVTHCALQSPQVKVGQFRERLAKERDSEQF